MRFVCAERVRSVRCRVPGQIMGNLFFPGNSGADTVLPCRNLVSVRCRRRFLSASRADDPGVVSAAAEFSAGAAEYALEKQFLFRVFRYRLHFFHTEICSRRFMGKLCAMGEIVAGILTGYWVCWKKIFREPLILSERFEGMCRMKVSPGLCGYLFVLLICCSYGCVPLLFGSGVAGGYKVATDERSAGGMLDDSTITAKVKAQMVGAEEVKALNIDVDTVDGVVILSGFVDSADEKSHAAVIARAVEGVSDVLNDLRVGSRSTGEVLDDKIIGSKVKARLLGEPYTRSFNIDVDVYLGVASLSGIVHGSEQKKTILEIVRSTEGVEDIVDHVKVK